MRKTNRINLFKIDEDFNLSNFSSINEYTKVFSNKNSCLFIQKDKVSIPEWSNFISSLAPSYSFRNNSNSFVYFRVHNYGLYALTGGHGYKVIQDYIDDEFGLNVALRLIDNLAISSIHQLSIKSQTRQIQRSVANYNPSFDNENYNKILKSISGKGNFSGKSFMIQGKSSVVLRTEKNISEIDSVLDEIENILLEKEKIQIFRSYQQVKDKELIHRLNLILYRNLYKVYRKDDNNSNLYLDLPDPFKRFDYSGYTLRIKKKNIEKTINIDELDINEIKSKILESFKEPLSLKEILNIHVTCNSNDGDSDIYHKKTLDKLIISESSIDNKYYVKLDRKWFLILDNIISFIDDKISNITIEKDYLPKWHKKEIEKEIKGLKDSGEKISYAELVYNKSVAQQRGYLLLDRDLIKLDKKSKIELADLYDASKNRFIHVKNCWGAKSAYLFSQALIASALYENSKEFKEKCQECFNIQTSDKKTIVIAIAIEEKYIMNFPSNMSAFAKLSLYNAVTNIRNYGYDVILAPIAIV